MAIDLIGVEIEVATLSTRDANTLIHNAGLSDFMGRVTRDASVETPANQTFITENMSILSPSGRGGSKYFLTRGTTLGCELVSKPLGKTELPVFLEKMIRALIKEGETVSPRTSIHLHIGFPNSLPLNRNILALGFKLEPLFYRLAGLGNPYRGEINNSIYSRPLVLGHCIPATDGKWYVPDLKKALSAKTLDEFWRIYGVYTREPERYVPARYYAWNVYSILLRETIEFRYFNMTTQSRSIVSIARFLQSIVEGALSSSFTNEVLKEFEDLNPFENYSDSVYAELINKLVVKFKKHNIFYDLSTKHTKDLLNILNSTPHHNIGEKFIKTHTRVQVTDEYAEAWGWTPVSDPKDSNYIDIHSENVNSAFKYLT